MAGRRVSASASLLKEKYTFLSPQKATEKDILSVHTTTLLEAVKTGAFEDPDTPTLPGMDGLQRPFWHYSPTGTIAV
jgi:acetoin utilization deacetylase AcuC-like enzyme